MAASAPMAVTNIVPEGLKGKVAIIAGGAGDVGEGIVHTFLRGGATVIVPSRSQEKLEKLRNAVEPHDGVLVAARILSFDDTELARVREDVLSRFGRIDAVVASLGGWWQGKTLAQTDAATWQRLLEGGLDSHLVLVRAFIPFLAANGGSYTLVNGGAALAPVPLAAAISIIAAAQLMLGRCLIEETKHTKARVNQLILNSLIATRSRPSAKPEWLTAEEVGAAIAWIASDAGSMISGSLMTLGQKSIQLKADVDLRQ